MSNIRQEKVLNHPLSVGNTVNLSFENFKNKFLNHFLPFLIFSFLSLGVVYFLIAPSFPLSNLDLTEYFNPDTGYVDPLLTQILTEILLLFIIQTIFQNAIMSIPIAISIAIAKNSYFNENKGIGDIINEIVPKFPIIIILGGLVSGLLFLSLLIVMIASVFVIFIIGEIGAFIIVIGFILAISAISVWFAVVMVIIVVEEPNISALNKSKSLASGNFSGILGKLIVIGLVQFLISVVIEIALSVFIDATDNNVYLIQNTIISSIVYPLTGISIFYIYLDLKWRKENQNIGYGYKQHPIYQQQPPPYQQQPPPHQQQQPPSYQQQPPHQQSLSGYTPPSSFKKPGAIQGSDYSNLPPKTTGGKFCGYCGAPAVKSEDKFCSSCGKQYQI